MGQGTDAGVSAWRPSTTSGGQTVIISGSQPIGVDLQRDEDGGAPKPLPERLVTELTAHRTLALREAIGRSPDVALTLLMKLATDVFCTPGAMGSYLEAPVN